MKPRAITQDQIDCAIQRREEGEPTAAIARSLGVKIKTLDYHLRKLGVFPPGWKPKTSRPPKPYKDRNGRTVRPFTPDEDRILMEMDLAGQGYAVIAKRLGRRTHVIRARAVTLANRELLAE